MLANFKTLFISTVCVISFLSFRKKSISKVSKENQSVTITTNGNAANSEVITQPDPKLSQIQIIKSVPKDPLDIVAKDLTISKLFLNPVFKAWHYETNYVFSASGKIMFWNQGQKIPYAPMSSLNTLGGFGMGSWSPIIFTLEHAVPTFYLMKGMPYSIATTRKNSILPRGVSILPSLQPNLNGMAERRWSDKGGFYTTPASPNVGIIIPYDQRDQRTLFSSKDLYEILANRIYDVVRTKEALRLVVGNHLYHYADYYNLLERLKSNDSKVSHSDRNVGAWLPLMIHNTGVQASDILGSAVICTRLYSRSVVFICLDPNVDVQCVYQIQGGVNIKAVDFTIKRSLTFTTIQPKSERMLAHVDDLLPGSLMFAIKLTTKIKTKCYYMEV